MSTLLGINHFWPTTETRNNHRSASAIIARYHNIKQLSHPNLCHVFDVSQSHSVGFMYSVSSHYPTSLASFLASLPNTRLEDFDLATRFALQLTHALNHLAKNNVYHLILSLKNILIDENAIKLSNYHLNYITDGGCLGNVSIGYPEMLAPEVMCVGDPTVLKYVEKADVWTLGLILVDILLGLNHRFPANTPLSDVLSTDYKWLDTLQQDLASINTPDFLIEFIQLCLTPSLISRPTFETLLNHPLFSNIPQPLPLSLNSSSITLQDQYNLHKLTNPTFIEVHLQKHGVTSIPSIERLPLYVSVTSTQANFDSDGPNTTGIYRDEIHTYILTLFDPTEINIPSFTSTFKGFSEPWSVYIKSLPTSSKTKAKPRKPLTLKEKNAVYQCYRLLTLKQLIAEYPLSKTELLREAAIDIPPLLRAETWSCLLSIDPNAPTPEYDLLDKSLPTQSDHQLSLDIPRCHQYNTLLSSPDSHAAQTRILKAWIQTESPLKNVYWQGLDALLAPFLALNYPNEGRAYVCFKAFVGKYFDGLFREDNSGALGKCLKRIEYLVAMHDPLVASHLYNLGISPDMYAIPWVMTMFAQVLQLDRIYHLWDTLLQAPPTFPPFLVVSLLIQLRESLLQKDFSACLLQLSELPPIDIESLIFTATETWRQTPPSIYTLTPQTPLIPQISLPDLTSIIKNSLIIDCRDADSFSNHHIQGSISYSSALLEIIKHKSKAATAVVCIYSEVPTTADEAASAFELVVQGGISHVCILASDFSRMPSAVSMCCCGAVPQCTTDLLRELGLH
ncbi:RabGAP/TBC [Rhizoclosmatium globosum]|uniref:RabGAP/TBC n=1 Tax=Rhizoclosmatium globosum TaxID=329046 RepID=A0A1Y2B632_9FUNG|nr:RabGAP/TBC [Rhizoclosmatium globosum]|eukprot:ORY29937.1 RabGAP/TBC [Rhizoclosmatium globosum]